jgi:hypothetical protein
MWAYDVTKRSKGRTPTGAELDRIAGTNNFGRRVQRKWREPDRIPSADVNRRNGYRIVVPSEAVDREGSASDRAIAVASLTF